VSVLNDFFLAADEELAAVQTRYGPWPPPPVSPKKRLWPRRKQTPEARDREPSGPLLPVVDAKGVMDVELATLERILHGESIDDVDAVVDLIQGPIRQEPESDPEAWISPVSDRLVAALASADEAQLVSAAEAWVATEEMGGSGWSRDEAANLLVALGELCRRGQAEQRRVYRWFSL
jgi:hypothetical protein